MLGAWSVFGLERGLGFTRMRGNSTSTLEGPKREMWRESDGLYYCMPVQAFVQLWEAWLSAWLGPGGARPLYKCLHCRKHPGNSDVLWSPEKEGLEKK